jgi:threonine aldolase
MAHTYRWEAGGAAVLGSVQPQPLTHQADGTLALADIEAAIKPDDAHFARSRLLCLENTLGGKALRMDYMADATALARRRGLATHLDGARLFNAAVKLDVRRATSREHFDSVSVCFSKGWARRSARRWSARRDSSARAPLAQDARRRHAPGRHPGGGRALRARPPRRAPGRRPRARAAPGRRPAGHARAHGRAAATNIVFADVERRRADGLIAHLKSRGVLATGCTGCAS